jgi:hypothetical protein
MQHDANKRWPDVIRAVIQSLKIGIGGGGPILGVPVLIQSVGPLPFFLQMQPSHVHSCLSGCVSLMPLLLCGLCVGVCCG